MDLRKEERLVKAEQRLQARRGRTRGGRSNPDAATRRWTGWAMLIALGAVFLAVVALTVHLIIAIGLLVMIVVLVLVLRYLLR